MNEQPRFVVEHAKDGRTHRHVIWSRIDADSMTAISDSLTYAKHEHAARLLEREFGHEEVPSVLVKDRDTPRPERNPKDWESLRAQDSKIDPKAMKAELTALWQSADSGKAFTAALHEHGYILARGDRRDFCVIDQAGDEHSLGRRLAGVKAAELRERMTDVARDELPTVADARALAQADADTASTPAEEPAAAPEEEETDSAPVAVLHAPETAIAETRADAPAEPSNALWQHLQAYRDAAQAEAQGRASPAVEASAPATQTAEQSEASLREEAMREVHNQNIEQAKADAASVESEEASAPGSRMERLRQWWGNMRETFSDWRGQFQERCDHYRSAWREPEQSPAPEPLQAPAPTTTMEPDL